MHNTPEAATLSPALPVGTILGSYIIRKVIGSGGFGITYLAQEEITEKLVVIKENYPADISFRDMTSLMVGPSGESRKEAYDWALTRFLEEAKILSRLSHPNIVPIRNAFKALGTAYYVMPHVEGTELYKAAPAPRNITAEWLLPVLEKILSALGYLHAQGLIHRDIKPNNILMRADGEPILIDFGTARALESTHSHTHIGTPGFMPFEQLSGRGKRGPWTDFYALGATCYYLITGELPPHSVDRIEEDEYLPLAGNPPLAGRFPEHVLSSIDKALCMNRHERWQSAQEWLDALKGILTSPSGKTSPSVKLKPNTAPIAPPASSKKKSKLLLILVSLLLCAALGCGAFFYPNIQPLLVGTNPDEYNVSLYTAAQDGNAEKVHLCLKAGADVNWANEAESQNTPLHTAANNGHVDCVRLLLAAPGSDVNQANENGETPLILATKEGHTECVRLLLAAPGIDVNQANKYGYTPLSNAAFNDHTECVRLLLAAPGININQADKDGETPLILATKEGHTECVRLLLNAPGIDVNKENENGETPLHWAENNNHSECADLIRAAGEKSRRTAILLEQMGISSEQYNSSLYAAALVGNAEKVKLLISAGADVNWKDAENGNTPLFVATINGHTECIRLLLTAPGIDVNKANGYTPLIAAAGSNHTEPIRLLLAAPGIDVNKANLYGYTPLSEAARIGRTESIRLLLAAPGIDVNNGIPLSEAARLGHTECVKLLLAAPGININQANQHGSTPLSMAADNGHTECVRLLLAAPGIDVNKANRHGYTPLFCAAQEGHTECVRLLLAAPGIDINKASSYGATPLSEATANGHTECANLIRAAGGRR